MAGKSTSGTGLWALLAALGLVWLVTQRKDTGQNASGLLASLGCSSCAQKH